MEHQIELRDAKRVSSGQTIGLGKSFATYRGELLGEFRTPMCSVARILLERGIARPTDLLTAIRNGVRAKSGKVGRFAGKTVEESDTREPPVGQVPPLQPRGSRQARAAVPSAPGIGKSGL